MNPDAKIRGYSVKRQADFIRSSHFDEATRKRVLDALPPRFQGNLDDIQPAEWYPWSDSVTILRAIASTRSDDASARQLLATCGEWIALEGANTFLKLVMKLMNPQRFANKLPSLWDRDMSSGGFVIDDVDTDKKVLRCQLKGVEGYDHISAVSEGWIRFAMKAMGEKGVDVKLEGWSLATPGPEVARYEVTWT
jgi:hypothetical protein